MLPVLLFASGCAVDVRPPLEYPSVAACPGEFRTALTLEDVRLERPGGEVLGRYGSALSLQLTYRAADDLVARWFRSALTAELASRGVRAAEPDEGIEAPRLRVTVRGLVFVNAVFHRKAVVGAAFELEREGRKTLVRTWVRGGEPSPGSSGWEGPCAEALNEALRALLLAAVPEIVEALSAP